jgi:hypothetical protein
MWLNLRLGPQRSSAVRGLMQGSPARRVVAGQEAKAAGIHGLLAKTDVACAMRHCWRGSRSSISIDSSTLADLPHPKIGKEPELSKVYNLSLRQWVGPEPMQDSSTPRMHFTVAKQIAYLAGKFTLRLGDVIATGSPAGNGRPRGIFLKAGQKLTVEIERIGRLHNPIVQGE